MTIGNLYTAYVSTLGRECNIYITGFFNTASGDVLVQARPVCYADKLLYHAHEIRPLQGASAIPTGRDVVADVIDGVVSGVAKRGDARRLSVECINEQHLDGHQWWQSGLKTLMFCLSRAAY